MYIKFILLFTSNNFVIHLVLVQLFIHFLFLFIQQHIIVAQLFSYMEASHSINMTSVFFV